MKYTRLIRRNLFRRPARTLLTLLGIASATLLFVGVESLADGMDDAIGSGESVRTLIVYRKNRYCPQTSIMPESYQPILKGIEGVESALPVLVYLNNCRTNLDMVTFQGVPADQVMKLRDVRIVEGSAAAFAAEGDAALVGESFARRRGLHPGDKFRWGEILVKVAGIYESNDAVEEGLVLTHLEYLQRSMPLDRQGKVTQFEVKVRSADEAKSVAAAIDARLAAGEDPTDTRVKADFLERATRDLREILGFARFFGAACVAVVLVLVANTIYMSVHDRRKEFGVFRTIGFKAGHLLRLVLGEALTLGCIGGIIGVAAAVAILRFSGLAIGVEGVSISFSTAPLVIAKGIVAAMVASAIAGILPSLQASRSDVVRSLRSI